MNFIDLEGSIYNTDYFIYVMENKDKEVCIKILGTNLEGSYRKFYETPFEEIREKLSMSDKFIFLHVSGLNNIVIINTRFIRYINKDSTCTKIGIIRDNDYIYVEESVSEILEHIKYLGQ